LALCAAVTIAPAANADATPPPRYQWLHEETPLPGATNRNLSIACYSPADAGTYRLVESNFAGSVTSIIAKLPVPLHLADARMSLGGFQFAIHGGTGRQVVLQSSDDLI